MIFSRISTGSSSQFICDTASLLTYKKILHPKKNSFKPTFGVKEKKRAPGLTYKNFSKTYLKKKYMRPFLTYKKKTMPKQKPAVLRQCIAFTQNAHPTTDVHVQYILHWLRKQHQIKRRILHYFIILEHKGEPNQHVHGGYVLATGETISNARNTWVRLLSKFPEFDPKVLRDGIVHWYNWNWVTNYAGEIKHGKMQLPDQYVEIENTLPSDPSLIPFAEPDDQQDKRPLNPWFEDREAEYLQFHASDPVTYPLPAPQRSVALLIDYLMYDKKSILVISDPRILTNQRKALTKFINGGDPNAGSNCPLPREDPLVHSLESINWWKNRTFSEILFDHDKYPVSET